MKAPKQDVSISFDLADNSDQKRDNIDQDTKAKDSSSEPEAPATGTNPYDIHKAHTLEATPLNIAQQISDDLIESSFKASSVYQNANTRLDTEQGINFSKTKQPQELNTSAGMSTFENSKLNAQLSQMNMDGQPPLSDMGSNVNQDTLSSLAAELKESFGLDADKKRKIRLMILASTLIILLVIFFVILPQEPSFVSNVIEQVDTSSQTNDPSLITEDHSLTNKDLGSSTPEKPGVSSVIQAKLSDVVDMVKGVVSPGAQPDPNLTSPSGNGSTEANPIQTGASVVGGTSPDNSNMDLASRIEALKSMLLSAMDGWNRIKEYKSQTNSWTPEEEQKLEEVSTTLSGIETASPDENKIKELEDKVNRMQLDLAAASSVVPNETEPPTPQEEIVQEETPDPSKYKKRIYETPMVKRTPYAKDLPQDQVRASGQIPQNPYWFLPNRNFDPNPTETLISQEQENEFIQRLNSPFNYQRYQAVLDLKRMKLKGSESIFEQELSEDKLWLRMNSLMALADLGVRLSVDSVEQVLKQERSDLVAGFFKRYASREYVTDGELLVLRFAIRVTDKYSRFNILRALRRWDPNLSDLYFTAASYDPDPKIKKYAATYLMQHPIDEETRTFYLEVITGTTDVDFAYESQTDSEISSLEVH